MVVDVPARPPADRLAGSAAAASAVPEEAVVPSTEGVPERGGGCTEDREKGHCYNLVSEGHHGLQAA